MHAFCDMLSWLLASSSAGSVLKLIIDVFSDEADVHTFTVELLVQADRKEATILAYT